MERYSKNRWIVCIAFMAMLLLMCMQSAFAGVITLPENLKVIENEAFMGDTSLITVILEDGIAEIGDRAFSGCTELKEISIPASVKKIGENVFSDCSHLSISCPRDSAAHLYAEKNNIKVILPSLPDDGFPDGLEYEVYDTYAVITGYTGTDERLVLPDEISGVPVTVIADNAFESCGFSHVTLPKFLKEIGAYINCIKLSERACDKFPVEFVAEFFCIQQNIRYLPYSQAAESKMLERVAD